VTKTRSQQATKCERKRCGDVIVATKSSTSKLTEAAKDIAFLTKFLALIITFENFTPTPLV
jgi:hypothetical protein